MARILVVEDEPTIAIALRDDLEIEGYAAEIAGDGATAETKAREGHWDLILLDIMLPRKDGFAVCRDLRSAGVQTPIILLTARGHEIDKVLGLELGADDYVTKPFSSRELMARIKVRLRRSSGAPARDVHQFGALRVDLRRCEAAVNGAAVPLTATEFKLLRTFVEHRGEALSPSRLLQLVWDDDVFVTERAVYTHINNLRAKIESDAAHPRLITSIRGVGYRFCA